MVDGQVGFHRPENVKRMKVEKHNSLVKQIDKTRVERNDVDLYEQQQKRLAEIQRQKKNEWKKQAKLKEQQRIEAQQEKEARSYDRLFCDPSQMTSVSEVQATADSTAAEEYEDDFF
jgi:hypothetical protein